MAEFPIPEGYALLGPVNTKVAKQALAEAVENGFGPESVLTRHDGFLVPLPRPEVDDEPEDDDVIDVLDEPEEDEQHEISPEATGDVVDPDGEEVIDEEIEEEEQEEDAEEESEPAPRPDTSWTNADIEKWASEQTPAIEVSGTKAEMLKTINDTLEVK